MHILHTESSNGWGGQEIRILKEAEGMRSRGYTVVMAVAKNGGLAFRAREKGFKVYELHFNKKTSPLTLLRLVWIIKKHKIELVNTHSSLDAWLGGVAGRISGTKIIRTRHLSTAIKPGLNSRLLYNALADYVITTSSSIIPMICNQSGLSHKAICCIPTGVSGEQIQSTPEGRLKFRELVSAGPDDLLVGTACFVRSWKGIMEFMQAAKLLENEKNIKWAVVGGGYFQKYKRIAEEMQIIDKMTFTGHLEAPFDAIDAFDIFALLSTAHEGISQASLQAAYLKKPLITTSIGGLPEVCIQGHSGIVVQPFAAKEFANAVLKLKNDHLLRRSMGENAGMLVEKKFTFRHTLDQMEAVYKNLASNAGKLKKIG